MQYQPNYVDLVVGQRIATLRKSAGIEPPELADRLGVSPQLLASVERGHRRAGARMLSDLADLLQLPVLAFFGADYETMTAKPTVH
jgi:transcriptional regulator with XRE-family HTH domain